MENVYSPDEDREYQIKVKENKKSKQMKEDFNDTQTPNTFQRRKNKNRILEEVVTDMSIF